MRCNELYMTCPLGDPCTSLYLWTDRVTSKVFYLVQYLVALRCTPTSVVRRTSSSYGSGHLWWCGPCRPMRVGFIPSQLVPELHVMWCDTPSSASSTSEAWHLWPAGKLSEQLWWYFSQLGRQSITIDTEEVGCPNNAWCSWEKRFLSWWSVPTLLF